MTEADMKIEKIRKEVIDSLTPKQKALLEQYKKEHDEKIRRR